MGVGPKWEEYEHQFLDETFPSEAWSLDEIAEKLERSPRAVLSKARLRGLFRPRPNGGARRQHDYAEIQRRLDSGDTLVEVAEAMGCAITTVHRAKETMKRGAA